MRFHYIKTSNHKKTESLYIKKAVLMAVISFLTPLAGFVLLLNSPLANIYYHSFIVHSILLIIICSISFTLFYFTYYVYLRFRNVRIFTISCFFYTLAIVFFLHAISLFDFYFISREFFDITEHLGLFLSSVLLLIFVSPLEKVKHLTHSNRKLILIVLSVTLLVLFVSLFISQDFTDFLHSHINLFIILTAVFLLLDVVFAIIRYIVTRRETQVHLIAVLGVLINIGIIPLFYKEWNLVWWYFHLVILVGLLAGLSGIIANLEKSK